MNLLNETIRCLSQNNKTEGDVLWVGRTDKDGSYKTSWEDFKSKADFEYDDGYGWAEIPLDLIVVGKDFWLERREYDGSEWWAFMTPPVEPTENRELFLQIYDPTL